MPDTTRVMKSEYMHWAKNHVHARWYVGASPFMVDSASQFVGPSNYTLATNQAAYYYRNPATFGAYARNYCNKCHAKD